MEEQLQAIADEITDQWNKKAEISSRLTNEAAKARNEAYRNGLESDKYIVEEAMRKIK